MDLGAYINIDNLGALAKEHGIYVPRLRGYRLMKDEKPVTKDEALDMASIGYEAYDVIQKHFLDEAIKQYTKLLRPRYGRAVKSWVARHIYLYTNTDRAVDRYCDMCDVAMEKIHGKLRKKVKFVAKKAIRRALDQYNTWNKYAGRDDVMYIHARIGGNNWDYFDGPEIAKQPWFLEKVDDSFDSTYCDIYAKLI